MAKYFFSADSSIHHENLKKKNVLSTANIIFMSHGVMNGWMAPATIVLLSDESPLKTGPLTNEQLSWVGSLSAFGGIIGTFSFGFIITYFGCKRAMVFLTLPSVVFWVLIYFGNSYYHLVIARLCQGWTGGGIQSTAILFISEIANNE